MPNIMIKVEHIFYRKMNNFLYAYKLSSKRFFSNATTNEMEKQNQIKQWSLHFIEMISNNGKFRTHHIMNITIL